MPTSPHTHERLTADEPIKGSSDRSFGLVIAAVATAFATWPAFTTSGAIRYWLLIPAIALFVVAVVRPSSLRSLNQVWTRLGLLMHHVTSPLVLGIIFFGVVMPIGLILRVLDKRPLQLKYEPDAATYWIQREPPGPDGPSLSNQF